MSKITFDQIRNERSPDELFRMKVELADEVSEFHVQMHDGVGNVSRSQLLKDINHNNDFIEYIDVRIKEARNRVYIEEKERRFGLSRFKELCKERLPKELFMQIEMDSKDKGQS